MPVVASAKATTVPVSPRILEGIRPPPGPSWMHRNQPGSIRAKRNLEQARIVRLARFLGCVAANHTVSKPIAFRSMLDAIPVCRVSDHSDRAPQTL